MVRHFRLSIIKVIYLNVCLILHIEKLRKALGEFPVHRVLMRFWSVPALPNRESQEKNHSSHCRKQRQRSEAGILDLFQISTHLDAFNTEHLLNASCSLGQRESWAICGLQLPGLKNWSEYRSFYLRLKNSELLKLETDIWITWYHYSSIAWT